MTNSTRTESPVHHWSPTTAKWIWVEGEERPKNAFVQFRTTFHLDAVPASAPLHVTADCKYLLRINGEIVGRGPITSDPKYKQVDPHDAAPFLRVGENVIAVLVLQRHEFTSRLWPVRGGFLLEMQAGEMTVATGAGWKARQALEYKRDVPLMTHQYGHQEWYDSRLAVEGWAAPGFDDSGWEPTVEVPDAAGFWPQKLELRAMPQMLREIVRPVSLVGYFSVYSKGIPAEELQEPARQIYEDFLLSSVTCWGRENITDPSKGPVVFRENMTDGIGFVVDLGEEMFGYPFIEFECPEGVVLDLGHGELLSRNRVQTVLLPASHSEQRYAERYYSRGGRQRWEIFDAKGCRYLEFHFHYLPKDETGASLVKIQGAGFIRSRAPQPVALEFECSDPLLARIFGICRRTAEVKSQDWHICDVQREQNQWLESYQDMLLLQCHGRCELVRQMLEAMARAQLDSGYVVSPLPGIWDAPATPDNQWVFSTTWLTFLITFDWLHGGSDPRQDGWLEAARKALDVLWGCLGPDNVLTNIRGDHWVEWSGMDVRPACCGRPVSSQAKVAHYNGMTILSLEGGAGMAEAFGKHELAAEWRRRANILRAGFHQVFWSDDRQAYVDGIYDGVPSDIVSQTTNAMAILAGVGDEASRLQLSNVLTDPTRHDVTSCLNSMALVHQALESLERDEAVVKEISTIWGRMIEQGATTTWEQVMTPERSTGCCYGFSSHPLNYFVRNHLGIIPLMPGYQEFSFRLNPGHLTSAAGRVPTPQGLIGVSWERAGRGIMATLDIPVGCKAWVALPRGVAHLSQDASTLDGRAAHWITVPVATCSFIRKAMPAFSAPAGSHEICFPIQA